VRIGLDMLREAIDQAGASGGTALDKLTTAMRKYAEIVTMDFGMCVIRVGEDPLPPASRKELRKLKGVLEIGPDGAGKTSLFNTISGFYRPTAGRIPFQGEDITRLPAPKRATLGRHCHLLTKELDHDDGEVTATMKVRRASI
jgi:hypothetical protein